MSDKYDGDDRRAPVPPPDLGWHLKKEVNLSIIIGLIGIAAACITGYTDLKRDVALIQADAQVLHQKISKSEGDLDRSIAVLQAHYVRMDSKLDRLIERTSK